jgi:hypothetical protein
MGRTREYYDMPTVRRIVRETAARDYKFSAIVEAVVASEQFRMRRAPAGQAQPESAGSAGDPVAGGQLKLSAGNKSTNK